MSSLCSVGYVQNHSRGITRTLNYCKLCATFIPIPGTSESSVRPWHYPGYGYALGKYPGAGRVRVRVQHSCTYLPGILCVLQDFHTRTRSSVSSGRLRYPYDTRKTQTLVQNTQFSNGPPLTAVVHFFDIRRIVYQKN